MKIATTQKTSRILFGVIRDEVAKLGAEIVREGIGRKHRFVVIARLGGWRKLTFPGTPGCDVGTVAKRTRSNVRRTVAFIEARQAEKAQSMEHPANNP